MTASAPRPMRSWRRLCALAVLLAAPAFARNDKLPEPPVIAPPPADAPTQPPGDATVLFGGKDLSGFTAAAGGPAPWKVADGVMTAAGGDIVSKHQFADAQIHVEFNLPVTSKDHGNSGLYIHGLYEIQIIDSHGSNRFKPAQQCASLYTVYPPLANVCLPPGQWQRYDILFHGAKLDENGKLVRPARFTVFHNGVLVQYNRPLKTGTGAGKRRKMVERGPLRLQDHGSPVRFRNIWVRPIAPLGESTGPALPGRDGAATVLSIAPATLSTQEKAGEVPGGAVVLFGGRDASGWKKAGKADEPIAWKIENGYMQVARRSGTIESKTKFADAHLHVEWRTPAEVKGSGQGRGNSGVYLHGRYEVQVLDSYNNKTYADGQAGAIYSQYAPQVNASRPPGRWQTYDIVFRAPQFDKDGRRTGRGTITVLHNGVLVQDHVINKRAGGRAPKDGAPITGPLKLQDHGNPVRYRNIWFRPLPATRTSAK